MNRRTFLISSATLAAGSPFIKSGPFSLKVVETKVISKEPSLYHGWPTVAKGRKKELYLVYSGGREGHICPFGRVEMMRSHDNGESWTWPEILMDSPIDDRDAGVLVTSKGTILVTTFTSLAYEPFLSKRLSKERLARWRAAHDRLSKAKRKEALGVWMIRSTDGGVTWSGRYDTKVNSPHGPVQLSDGTILYAGKELWKKGGPIGVCLSKDDGLTWSRLAQIKPRPGDSVEKYHELHALEVEPNRLIVQIRNHNKRNYLETLQCESYDNGKSWTLPHSIGVWGLPSHLLKLKSGRLLMTYGHRREPFGIQARISNDKGETWSGPLLIYTQGAGHDLGYPSTVELSSGELLTVWYEKKKTSPKAVLCQARWRLT